MRNNNIIYSTGSHKRIREGLMMVSPFCYWCDTALVNDPDSHRLIKKLRPENLATLDHIITRSAIRVREKHNSPKVLSCFRCDHTRSKMKILDTDIEKITILWREKLKGTR